MQVLARRAGRMHQHHRTTGACDHFGAARIMREARDVVDQMRARFQRSLHHRCLARVHADRRAHAGAGLDRGDDAFDLVAFPQRLATRARAFAAHVDDRCPRFDHGGGVVTAGLGIVQEAPTVAEAVGRDVEDAHHLRLVERHGPRPQLQRRMRERQIGPLRLALGAKLFGQAAERFGHGVRRRKPALDHLAISPLDHRKSACIDHCACQPDGIAMFGLRPRNEPDRPDIDLPAHCWTSPGQAPRHGPGVTRSNAKKGAEWLCAGRRSGSEAFKRWIMRKVVAGWKGVGQTSRRNLPSPRT